MFLMLAHITSLLPMLRQHGAKFEIASLFSEFSGFTNVFRGGKGSE